MFRCSCIMCLLKNEISWVGTRKRCFCFRSLHPVTGSSGSIHETCPAPKRLHHTSSRCDQIREKCFAHQARVGKCHRRDVQFQSMRAAPANRHALHAPLLLCAPHRNIHCKLDDGDDMARTCRRSGENHRATCRRSFSHQQTARWRHNGRLV